MSTQHPGLWSKIIGDGQSQEWLSLAMRHAAHILGDMVKRSIKIHTLRTEIVPLNELTLVASDPEAETLGVYLSIGDDLPGQAMLMLSLDDAMYLADWLLELRPGTTTQLGQLEYSALAEAGNVMLSSFLNALAELSQSPLRLSPPSVTVDMLATILQVVTTSVGAVTDELLIIKTDLKDDHDSIWLQFWVLPDPALLKTLNRSKISKVLTTSEI